jgi:hypothetical protein
VITEDVRAVPEEGEEGRGRVGEREEDPEAELFGGEFMSCVSIGEFIGRFVIVDGHTSI